MLVTSAKQLAVNIRDHSDFPPHISEPIFQGMRTLAQTQLQSRSQTSV
jgi:hypothetical protein